MPSTTAVNNFMVPATGTPNSVPVTGVFSATPTRVDFREIQINGEQFVPQGVFVDNTQGAAPLVISVDSFPFTLAIPAGAQLQTQYPAPLDQIVNITGSGQASIIFCDFPVLPLAITAATGGSAVTIADGADVALGATTDIPAANDTGNFSLIAFIKRISGMVTRIALPPATSTRSNVASVNADALLLAANTARQGAVIFNDGTANLGVLLSGASAASATNRSLVLAAGGTLVLGKGDYSGEIRGFWDAVNGNARITEITA